MNAVLHRWHAGLPSRVLDDALARLCRSHDVVHVAVMPDAHVADAVCVGTVTGTTRRILPAAVGGDIGCGMLALRFDADANALAEPSTAAALLHDFSRVVPPLVHPTQGAQPLPEELAGPLCAAALETLKQRDGRVELGTLGRGNHFLELQRDTEDGLWLLVHSGSRCMGPAIRRHYESRAQHDDEGFAWLDAEDETGQAYLADAAWAARYATINRARMVERATQVLCDRLRATPVFATAIACDHNHVRREQHQGRWLWVHRKGAMYVAPGLLGVVPGSMGSPTYHVEGRGVAEALCSSAHGAGRALARSEARKSIRARDLDAQMRGVWFDARMRDRLREEAPRAYKDIGEVMRAQHQLVRIVRRLTPLLVYKAG